MSYRDSQKCRLLTDFMDELEDEIMASEKQVKMCFARAKLAGFGDFKWDVAKSWSTPEVTSYLLRCDEAIANNDKVVGAIVDNVCEGVVKSVVDSVAQPVVKGVLRENPDLNRGDWERILDTLLEERRNMLIVQALNIAQIVEVQKRLQDFPVTKLNVRSEECDIE